MEIWTFIYGIKTFTEGLVAVYVFNEPLYYEVEMGKSKQNIYLKAKTYFYTIMVLFLKQVSV